MSADEDFDSIQKKLNTSPSGTINWPLYEKYKVLMKEKDFFHIKDLDSNIIKKAIGHRIAYVCKDLQGQAFYRTGGFLTNVYEEYFQYKGFNGQIFHVQKKNIIDFWIQIL